MEKLTSLKLKFKTQQDVGHMPINNFYLYRVGSRVITSSRSLCATEQDPVSKQSGLTITLVNLERV